MQQVTKTYTIYQYEELPQGAKDKALNNLIGFYLVCIPYDDMAIDMKLAIDKAESLRTPWFAGEYVLDYCKDSLVEELNQYNYLVDGSIFQQPQYNP